MIRDRQTVANILSYMGELYRVQGDLTNAQDYYQQALTRFQTLEDLSSIARVQTELRKLQLH